MKINALQALIISLMIVSCNQVINEQNTNYEDKITSNEAEYHRFSEIDTLSKNEIVNQLLSEKILDTTLLIQSLILVQDGEIIPKKDTSLKIFNLLKVDFDDDKVDEIIIMYGDFIEYPLVSILKKIHNDWKILFTNEFGNQYSGCELSIEKITDTKKLIIINNLEQRGSGIYKEVIYFYTIIENEVVNVIQVLDAAMINGWGLFINQVINSNFSINKEKDQIEVTYEYEFFPGPVYENNLSWESHPELKIIDDKIKIIFSWNEELKKYGLNDSKLENKIALFNEFGNDSLFIEVFERQIKKIIKEDKTPLSELMENYLEMYRNNNIEVPSGLLEKTKSFENGLEFYGSQKEK